MYGVLGWVPCSVVSCCLLMRDKLGTELHTPKLADESRSDTTAPAPDPAPDPAVLAAGGSSIAGCLAALSCQPVDGQKLERCIEKADCTWGPSLERNVGSEQLAAIGSDWQRLATAGYSCVSPSRCTFYEVRGSLPGQASLRARVLPPQALSRFRCLQDMSPGERHSNQQSPNSTPARLPRTPPVRPVEVAPQLNKHALGCPRLGRLDVRIHQGGPRPH